MPAAPERRRRPNEDTGGQVLLALVESRCRLSTPSARGPTVGVSLIDLGPQRLREIGIPGRTLPPQRTSVHDLFPFPWADAARSGSATAPPGHAPAVVRRVSGPHNNAFLMTLSEALQQQLVADVDLVHVRSGTDLYLPDDRIDWIYFPTAGLISLISVMRNGDEGETGVVGREGALGLIEALGSGCVLYRAVVQIELTALRMPSARFSAMFADSPGLRSAVAAHTELNLAELRQSLACRSHHPIAARLAWWLLECQDRTGNETLALTQEFLGAMLGSQRSTVNEAAAELRRANLIRSARGVIEILDRPGLESRACECYATVARYRQIIESPFREPSHGMRQGR